jgi:hypothetical protein
MSELLSPLRDELQHLELARRQHRHGLTRRGRPCLPDRCVLATERGEHPCRVEGVARDVCGLEGLGAHRGERPLVVEVGQPAFQRLDGLAQIRQGLVGRAVQRGGPAGGVS